MKIHSKKIVKTIKYPAFLQINCSQHIVSVVLTQFGNNDLFSQGKWLLGNLSIWLISLDFNLHLRSGLGLESFCPKLKQGVYNSST